MKAKHPNKQEEANRRVRLVPQRMPKLSPRLQAVAELVRNGAAVADIGTDHAYLPIWLVASGISTRAIACDLREGPLRRAAANVDACGLSQQIVLKQTDGLTGLNSFAPDDILICGMGGELIIRILEQSVWVCDSKIRLILQPMTAADRLRCWLCRSGFKIDAESMAQEDNRIYEIIAAHYSGQTSELSEARAIAGFAPQGKLFDIALNRKLARLQKQIDGWQAAGKDTTDLCRLKDELNELLSDDL